MSSRTVLGKVSESPAGERHPGGIGGLEQMSHDSQRGESDT
jgi:hypothetical protein